MITTPSQLLQAAINMGNMEFAKIIANSPEYLAEIEKISELPKAQINTTAADNASKRVGFDYEKAILARDERIMHTI